MKKFILIITLATITQCAYSADESAISEDQREFINLFFKSHIELDKNLSLKMKNNPEKADIYLNLLHKGKELYNLYYNSFFKTQNIISQAESLDKLMPIFGHSMASNIISFFTIGAQSGLQKSFPKNSVDELNYRFLSLIHNQIQILSIPLIYNQIEMLTNDIDSPSLLSIKSKVLLHKKAYELVKKKGIKSLDENQFEPIFNRKMKRYRNNIKRIISENKLNDSKVKKKLNDPHITKKELNDPQTKHLTLIALNAELKHLTQSVIESSLLYMQTQVDNIPQELAF